MVSKLCFGQNCWNSNDWIVRNRQVSAKAIGLNFSSNCACAAFNWVPRSVTPGFLRFISFETMCKSLNTRSSLPFYFYFCLFFLKAAPALHNTADHAETMFGHLKLKFDCNAMSYWTRKLRSHPSQTTILTYDRGFFPTLNNFYCWNHLLRQRLNTRSACAYLTWLLSFLVQ